MKVIQNKFIPFPGYKYINIFGILFTRDKDKITEVEYNHEKIHLKQMQEMLWLFFYTWYIIEYLIINICRGVFTKQNIRYHDISLEEEAYNNQENMNYTKYRKHYSWFKYIKIGSYDSTK